MNILVLNIDKYFRPKSVLDFIKQNNPQKGDKIKLVGTKQTVEALYSFIVMLMLALGYYFKKKKENENAESLLNDIFNDYKSTEELEKHIEKEYGIEVEIETSSDKKEWETISLSSIQKAYSVNEPDYDLLMVKEPNPDYKK